MIDILRRPNQIQGQIDKLMERREELIRRLGTHSPGFSDRVQTSHEDRMAAVMAEVADIDTEVYRAYQQKCAAALEILELTNRLPREDWKTVIVCYYIGGLSMEDIGEGINISRAYAFKYRADAIKYLEELPEAWGSTPGVGSGSGGGA